MLQHQEGAETENGKQGHESKPIPAQVRQRKADKKVRLDISSASKRNFAL